MTRAYGQYCPVTQGAEVLADRWTPMILREMVLGSTRFNDIERGLPGISRTLLLQRLRHLERKGVVERIPARGGRGSEYRLTAAGQDLEGVLSAIGAWAVRWLFKEPEPTDADPITLTWWMHRRVATEELPDARVVLEFRYSGPEPTVLWIVLDHGDPSVCTNPPGFDTDVIVETAPVALQRVFSGIDTLDHARRAGTITLHGPPALTRSFGTWFLWSPFAAITNEILAHPVASGR